MPRDCPDPSELQAFVEGRLQTTRLDRIADHAEQCETCLQVIEQLKAATDKQVPATSNPSSAIVVPAEVQQTAIDLNPGSTISSDKAHLPAADFSTLQIQGYDIRECIGQGGMGVVFRARDQKLKRMVALKVVRTAAQATQEDLQRFRAEAETAARLTHPHIVQVYEVGESNGQPYLSEELVDGGNLTEYFGLRPQPPLLAAGLMELAARAIHYAHQQGVVHRDLKPANILIHDRSNSAESAQSNSDFDAQIDSHSEPGGTLPSNGRLVVSTSPGSGHGGADHSYDGPEPKIADFGLARDDLSEQELIRAGAVLGTPNYMSPEQAAGDIGGIGPASDIYSLGAMLYFLLTGRPPFQAASTLETMRQVREDEPTPLRQLQRIPRDLETICLKCLEKNPRRRYLTAEDLAVDLRRFRLNEPVLAQHVSIADRFSKWVRRKPTIASLLAVLIVVTIGGLLGIIWQLRQAIVARDLAEDRAAAAVVAGTAAEEARQLAQRATADAETRLYFNSIGRALQYFRQGQISEARRLLDSCRPSPGEADRRHWEWWYLHGLLNAGLCEWHVGTHKDDCVYDLQFSPDHRHLAIGVGRQPVLNTPLDAPGSLQLWDLQTGRKAFEFQGDEPLLGIRRIRFSEDGGRLATAEVNLNDNQARWGPLRVWDCLTGSCLLKVPVDQAVNDFQLSPDGRTVALIVDQSATGNSATIYDVASGDVVWERSNVGILQYLSADEVLLVEHESASDQPKTLTVDLNDPTAEIKASETISRTRLPGLLHDPSAWDSVSGYHVDPGSIYRLRDPTGAVTATLPFPAISGVGLSPDGLLAGIGIPDGSVAVFDMASGQQLRLFRGHTDKVSSVAFSHSTNLVASGDCNGNVRIWDRNQPQEFLQLEQTSGAPHEGSDDLKFQSDNRIAQLMAEGGGLVQHDVETGRWKSWIDSADLELQGEGRQTAFSPDGERLYLASAERPEIIVLDVQTGRRVDVLSDLLLPCRYLKVSKDGRTLVAAAWSDEIKTASRTWLFIFDTATGQKRSEFSVPVRPPETRPACFALALAPDGGEIVICTHQHRTDSKGSSRTSFCRRFDAETGKAVHDYSIHGQTVSADHIITDAEFSPSGSLAVSDYGGQLLLLKDTGTVYNTSCPEGIEDLCFSPDGRRLASVSRRIVRLWDAETGYTALTLKTQTSAFDIPFNPRVCFSDDGHLLATTAPRAARILDARPRSLSSVPAVLNVEQERRDHIARMAAAATSDTIPTVQTQRERWLGEQSSVSARLHQIEVLASSLKGDEANSTRDELQQAENACVLLPDDRITLTCPPLHEHAEFTVEAWVRNWSGNLITAGSQEGVVLQLGLPASGLRSADGYFTSAAVPIAGHDQWHHLALVRDASGLRHFVDGQLHADVSFDGPAELPPETPLRIADAASGLVRWIRVSSTARYDGQFDPPADYDLDSQTLLLIDALNRGPKELKISGPFASLNPNSRSDPPQSQ